MLAGSVVLAISVNSCGKGSEPSSTTNADGVTPVARGQAAFANQCPFGSLGEFHPAKLELWSCPIAVKTFELQQDFEHLILQVDCTKKIITVRNESRTLDSSWEILANGHFDFDVDGGTALIKDDGTNHTGCAAPMTVNVIDCKDRDKVHYQIETVWKPLPATDAKWKSLPLPACKLPNSCYFFSTAPINQCQ